MFSIALPVRSQRCSSLIAQLSLTANCTDAARRELVAAGLRTGPDVAPARGGVGTGELADRRRDDQAAGGEGAAVGGDGFAGDEVHVAWAFSIALGLVGGFALWSLRGLRRAEAAG